MRTSRRRTNGLSAEDAVAFRPCAHEGCTETGLYRAPQAPSEPTDYYWFCLEHVRAYNRAWDFFAGMNQEQIYAYQKEDVVGHRPSWPFGVGRGLRLERLHDLFGLLRGWRDFEPAHPREASQRHLRPPEIEALAVLELDSWVDRKALKARYKALVKRHHPDANGGSKAAEERLKLINHAYNFLIETGRF